MSIRWSVTISIVFAHSLIYMFHAFFPNFHIQLLLYLIYMYIVGDLADLGSNCRINELKIGCLCRLIKYSSLPVGFFLFLFLFFFFFGAGDPTWRLQHARQTFFSELQPQPSLSLYFCALYSQACFCCPQLSFYLFT
jgi:hypothetical protein